MGSYSNSSQLLYRNAVLWRGYRIKPGERIQLVMPETVNGIQSGKVFRLDRLLARGLHLQRVDRLAAPPYTEIQMRACGYTCRADIADYIALSHP